MLDSPHTPELDEERLLTGMARGRFGRIAPELIAQHVLHGPSGADWPVRKAAFDALARRYAFARRDNLRVCERPAVGALGVYSTQSSGKGKRDEARPYQTALYALAPLRTSCSCADFVRSSLGLCKHGLAVLEALATKPPPPSAAGALALTPALRWDHQHPLEGNSDRLARLRYEPAASGPALPEFRDGKPATRALRDPAARLAFIDALVRTLARAEIEAEPAVSAVLAEERARAERKRDLLPLWAAASKTLGGLARKLYPYQREGVKRFFETGRLLLADDMGLGKTTQAIAAAHGLFEIGAIERGLLIVPAALKAQWKREWAATTSTPLTLVDGSPRERAKLYEGTPRGFLAIGYEQLLRDLNWVQGFAPQLVVLDEAQRIKNWATKSAAYVKSLAPTYRLVLTGTPMENRFDELASIMDFVDDLALEPKWRLLPLHAIPAAEGGGQAGARNLNVLRERLAGTMLRRVRKEVLKQLPPRTDTRVPVELSEVQRERHDELRPAIAELAGKASRRPLAQAEFLQLMQLLTRQRMICNGMAQVQFESEWPRCERAVATPELLASLFAPKLSALRGLVEQVVVDQQRKAVVFSQWRNMLRLSEWAVRDVLAAAGMRALSFTGAETPKRRERALLEFHDDPTATVMFLSDAGGVGLNLQRAASCCINLELPWNPAVLEQRIGRIYRIGQTLPIDVYNLVSEGGIEARIAKLLAAKQAVFATLFDGTSDVVSFEGGGSFLSSVHKLVDALPQPTAAEEHDQADDRDAAHEHLQLTAAEPLEPEPEQRPEPAPAQDTRAVLGRAGLSVERLPDGGLRIDAPPALAGALADLLESLAASLRH
jgi:hypothetical protein